MSCSKIHHLIFIYFFPGGCLETKEKQIKDFKKVFSRVKSEIPLVCVCGNHDVGDTPTVETINK